MTAGTPGLSTTGALLNDITRQAEHAWEHILTILARAGMTVADLVKVTQYKVLLHTPNAMDRRGSVCNRRER